MVSSSNLNECGYQRAGVKLISIKVARDAVRLNPLIILTHIRGEVNVAVRNVGKTQGIASIQANNEIAENTLTDIKLLQIPSDGNRVENSGHSFGKKRGAKQRSINSTRRCSSGGTSAPYLGVNNGGIVRTNGTEGAEGKASGQTTEGTDGRNGTQRHW